MEKERTINDVIDTFNEEQLMCLQYIIGVIYKNITFEPNKSDSIRIRNIINSLNEEQLKVFYFCVAHAKDHKEVI